VPPSQSMEGRDADTETSLIGVVGVKQLLFFRRF
jgi:hypothetical protein